MAESDTATNETQLRDAWDAFADDLKTMGRDALASAPADTGYLLPEDELPPIITNLIHI